MQITLLPPLLPTEAVTAVPTANVAFAPGMKVLATVLGTTADGGTLLSLGGRQVPAGEPLPYPAGTTLRLEVVAGGRQPLLRLIAAEPSASRTTQLPDASPSAAGPAVRTLTYGLAAAVVAAHEGGPPEPRVAAAAVMRWLPVLVEGGAISEAHASALARDIAPVPVTTPPQATPQAAAAAQAVADALAARFAHGGLLLERRLGELTRQAVPRADGLAAVDVRARLAALGRALEDAGAAYEPARQAVATLQEALLVEQARTAAHLARDGVVDVRVPLQADAEDAELRLRMRVSRDPHDTAPHADQAPWRQVALELALGGLGRVQVRLGAIGGHVRAEFFVERPDAADALEAGFADLAVSLEHAGFTQVLSRVVVDPVRVSAPDTLPDVPLHGGIVDARA